MQALSKILLPVDFSERSVGAARYANILATHFRSEVTLLHVMPLHQVSQELDAFLAAELAGLNVRRVVLEGDPAIAIVEFARAQSIGLIIMPTHGYGPFRRFILGSNTAQVLQGAECPVWTGVHIDTLPPASSGPFRNILCAVDLGAQSSRTLCWAAQLALEFGARLSLVHATSAGPEPDDTSEAAWQTGLRQATEAEIERLRAFVHAEADVMIEAGDPAKVICSAAERTGADLLVIGRGSAAGVFGRLRTNAYAIIRMSPCPVVSV